MNQRGTFKRVLLKLSGETLGGGDDPFEMAKIRTVAHRVAELTTSGTQCALVLGGGNLFRGAVASDAGMNRNVADHIGMLATVMNALAVKEVFRRSGLTVHVQTPFEMPGVTEAFHHARAVDHLESGAVVAFAGGTGHPFFTTDTTSALRACEIGADAVVKATKVDGVYNDDPIRNPAAKRYRTVSFADAVALRLGVMDGTAFALCQDNDIPIIVLDFFAEGALVRAVEGDLSEATLVGKDATAFA